MATILKDPREVEWHDRMTCDRCQAEFAAETEDLRRDGFKTSGNFFDDSAVVVQRTFVDCPVCFYPNFVPEDDLTWALNTIADSQTQS